MDSTVTGGLFCNLVIPFGWYPQTGSESDSVTTVERKNVERLQVIFGMDDHCSRESHEEEPGLSAEIQRLDFKINIILGLVAQLVERRSELPPPLPVALSTKALYVDFGRDAPPCGEMLTLELFLDSRYPFPLVFNGKVEATEGDFSQVGRASVLLEPLPSDFQELLEKYIFRCHRRHIANLKKNTI